MQFDHDKLDAYRLAIDLTAVAEDIVTALPSGRAYLADQLRRASTSVAFNIAEGAGEFTKRDKARFYRIARRSATESAAILDVCLRLGLVERPAYENCRALLFRVVSVLTQLVRALTRPGTGTGTGTFTGAR